MGQTGLIRGYSKSFSWSRGQHVTWELSLEIQPCPSHGAKMDAYRRYQGGVWVSCGQMRYHRFATRCDGKTSQSA